MRRGVHTSEFLLTALFQVGNLVAAIEGDLSPHWAAVAAAVSAAAYALARGWAKQGSDSTAGKPPA